MASTEDVKPVAVNSPIRFTVAICSLEDRLQRAEAALAELYDNSNPDGLDHARLAGYMKAVIPSIRFWFNSMKESTVEL